MATKSEAKTDSFQNGVPLLPRASGAVKEAARSADHQSKYGNNAIPESTAAEDGAGMPDGYKPDTSAPQKGAEGVQTGGGNVLPQLKEGHTYRDRVEAQAKSLGVEVVEGETMELLLWKIRMQASS